MLAHEFDKAAAKKASHIDGLSSFLKSMKGIDLASVPHHRAVDELRLLNNAIKHNDERVDEKLAQRYPRRWRKGKKLSGLDKAYDRLRPKVPAYIFRLAERMKLRYK